MIADVLWHAINAIRVDLSHPRRWGWDYPRPRPLWRNSPHNERSTVAKPLIELKSISDLGKLPKNGLLTRIGSSLMTTRDGGGWHEKTW